MTDVPPRLTWEELCADPSLRDLPYRIELNGLNQIVMSPLPERHSLCETKVAVRLSELMPEGKASVATAIMTSDNVKVADVTWGTDEFCFRHFNDSVLPVAPAICVEVLAPTNAAAEIDQKRALYFEAGAQEVWLCGLEGEMEFYTPAGKIERSVLCPKFPLLIGL